MKAKALKQLLVRSQVIRKDAEFEVDEELGKKLEARKLVEVLEQPEQSVEQADETEQEEQVNDVEEAKKEYKKSTVEELKEMAKEMEVDLKGITAKDDIIEKLIEAEFN